MAEATTIRTARESAEVALGHSTATTAVDMLEASRAANVALSWSILALCDVIEARLPAPVQARRPD